MCTWGSTKRCPVFSLGMLPVICRRLFMLVSVADCIPITTKALDGVCVCVYNSVLRDHFNSVSISYVTWGSWWWSGTRTTLPTQHQKLLMSYCCTLLWNIIALWCVNKARACCQSICSPAGRTGRTTGGRGVAERRARIEGVAEIQVLDRIGFAFEDESQQLSLRQSLTKFQM